MKFQYIAFDVDGTLIDTFQSEERAMEQALREVLGRKLPPHAMETCFGTTGQNGLARLGFSPEEIERVCPRWLELSNATIGENPLFDGVERMLERLRAAGCVMGAVTSRSRSEYVAGEKHCGLDRFFQLAVCTEDTVRHKPAPDPLLAFCERVGARPEEVLYVGDSEYDMQCAQAAGTTAALALWGTIDPSLPADFRAESPEKLTEYCLTE